MCSGNCSAAPRWPIEKSVFWNGPLGALKQLPLERAVVHVVDEEERAGAELDRRSGVVVTPPSVRLAVAVLSAQGNTSGCAEQNNERQANETFPHGQAPLRSGSPQRDWLDGFVRLTARMVEGRCGEPGTAAYQRRKKDPDELIIIRLDRPFADYAQDLK